jgi:hypothetical protein
MSFEVTIDISMYTKLGNERSFHLFKYRGMYCLIQRAMIQGILCGYVAVDKAHPLYGKDYNDKVVVKDLKQLRFNGNYLGWFCMDATEAEAGIIGLDMFIDVHCGLTFAGADAPGIQREIFPDLWWFGFDTAHAGDRPMFTYRFPGLAEFPRRHETYKDYWFVYNQICKLADQLLEFVPQKPLFDVQPFIERLERLKDKLCNQ